MRFNEATVSAMEWARWLRTVALALASLTGNGLTSLRAQMQFNGGFVQTRAEDKDVPRVAALKRTFPSPSVVGSLSSYSPDHDFFYASHDPVAMTTLSYYYYAGRDSARTSLPSLRVPSSEIGDGLPWNRPGFEEYRESGPVQPEASPSLPRRYALRVDALPAKSSTSRSSRALLVIHLPDHARFWVNDRLMSLSGPTRSLQSPPLNPGAKYSYVVSASWREDGHWVRQERKVLVQAGSIQAVYLQARTGSDRPQTLK